MFLHLLKEYLEQWHLLANLGSGVASEVQPLEAQDPPSLQSGTAGVNLHVEDIKQNNDDQEKVT